MNAQRCSDFAARPQALKVLMVGAERFDEFADAVQLGGRGHNVIVVNPRETIAARRFVNERGTFILSAIERLPSTLGTFNLICENYPYTVARVEELCEDHPCPVWLSARAMRAYAMARLRRLAPTGQWIVFTESPGFAGALRLLLHRDEGIRRNFSVRIVPLTRDEAPRSFYPHLSRRFQVIFQRRPAELRRNNGSPARTASL